MAVIAQASRREGAVSLVGQLRRPLLFGNLRHAEAGDVPRVHVKILQLALLGYPAEAEFCVSSSEFTSVTVRPALVNPLVLAGIATVRAQRLPASQRVYCAYLVTGRGNSLHGQFSRCPTFVPMMQSADLRQCNHRPKIRRLHGPTRLRVLVQG